MKFGAREVTDVVFKAKSTQKLGDSLFQAGEPVIYFDSAKTSTMESAATTVYAQGGRGNPRLLAWEGDKTATFTFEESLLSPLGFSILSGSNLIENTRIPFHETVRLEANAQEVTLKGATAGVVVPALDLSTMIAEGSQVLAEADENLTADGRYTMPQARIYLMELENDEISRRLKVQQSGSLTADSTDGTQSLVLSSKDHGDAVPAIKATDKFIIASAFLEADTVTPFADEANNLQYGKSYLVDFYSMQNGSEMTISAGKFAGYYYIEANTLFRRASDGKDLPAQFVIPKGKVQSNFTFTLASSGDPSTFTFTVDAFPDYTLFDQSCKVLFALQIADEPVIGGDC